MLEVLGIFFLCMAIRCFFGGVLLWLAGVLTGTDAPYLGMVFVIAVSTLAELPFVLAFLVFELTWLLFVGFLVSIVVFVGILKKVTRADFFPDLALMLLVYCVVSVLTGSTG